MRFHMIDPNAATGKAKRLLDGVQAKLGMTPNMMKAMANSPAVLEGYLNLSTALAGGLLDARTRERIALAVSQQNRCGYCLAAHTVTGGMSGLTEAEIRSSRESAANDSRTAAALAFCRELVAQRGSVPAPALQQVRDAGWSDGEIGEMVAHTALTIFTNYFNLTAETDIDFPAVPIELAVAA